MQARLNPFAADGASMMLFRDFGNAMLETGLEKSLMNLVETRASQINGCAVCLHMHTAAAREAGETEERLYLLDAWRESPLYSERERAALAWTEALTLVATTRAPNKDYERLAAHFTEAERVQLTLLIVTINGWNRINVGFQAAYPTQEKRAA